ncbi:Basic-leucine zipper (bZIP) transcription factor [Cordyceps fumosorosea ARSEF 2679]|uniref:Basic-leucine zipper (BZIP) transcription factor n=1 Tax=Cordyceps fumosorosea (strain ARSEF 2679) TaxID=1081104 RepID=A0A167S8R6_CORFA|nr:Basic-leucine zipper (bZIP) transcription factor [Cordyceps fumosorosea ARSEF 2679]OAA59373.1 Basic-leucine zipper (bZIP) transcription factor [Cordyceps fumosorosea ARSEF 2679]
METRFSEGLFKKNDHLKQPGLAQEANHNLRPWDQPPPQAPAAPASSSSSERHAGNLLSRSAWGDDELGGAFCPTPFLPDQFADIEPDPSWWSDCNTFFVDTSPELADLDWTLDDDLQRALAETAAALTTTLAAPTALPALAPAPGPMIPPADWSGFGVFDSNPPTAASSNSSGSTYPTPAVSSGFAHHHPQTDAHHHRRGRRGVDPDLLLKRQRNKVAAQRYRQKKLDRIAELEGEVADVSRERDDLRVRLAKQEAETAALRDMLKLVNPGMVKDS